MGAFRFALGDRVRVITHPARPVGIVVARWTAAEMQDPYGEPVYAVSVFVTRQRQSSLEPAGDAEPGAPPAAPPP